MDLNMWCIAQGEAPKWDKGREATSVNTAKLLMDLDIVILPWKPSQFFSNG